MIPSTSYRPDHSWAILGVGEPKSGKSCFGMSLPDPGIIDCDGNLAAAARRAPNKKFFISQPFTTDEGVEVPEADRWLRCEKETKLLLAHPETKSIWVDGLSNLCRWGLIYAEAELVRAGINVKKEYLAKYQAFIPLLSRYITMLRIPKKIVYVTSHQTIVEDETTKQVRYKLDIPGRLADTLGGQFTDVLGFSSIANPADTKIGARFFVRTKPTGFHVNLGTSLDLEPSIDVTGKSPADIWSIFSPKLSAPVTPTGAK